MNSTGPNTWHGRLPAGSQMDLSPPRRAMRKGLTLVELLATLAIVGMLTAAAMAVVSQLGRSRQLVCPPETVADLLPQIDSAIRPDVLHARQYRNTAGGFDVVGLLSIEPGSMHRRHSPVTVSYEVAVLDDVPWLIRRERPAGEPPRTELLCSGAVKIRLQDPTIDPDDTEADEVNTDKYIQTPSVLIAEIILAGTDGSETAHELRLCRQ